MSLFKEKVIEIVSKIPRGKILTYKKVAILAGKPKAGRAVGNILNRNFRNKGPQIPCHRVVNSNGKIGGYALGEKQKRDLLEKEGVSI